MMTTGDDCLVQFGIIDNDLALVGALPLRESFQIVLDTGKFDDEEDINKCVDYCYVLARGIFLLLTNKAYSVSGIESMKTSAI